MLTEPLEPRRLLAGVTLLTHGLNGDVDGWIETAAADIQARAGGTNASSIYTMTVAENSKGRLAVTGFGPTSGQKDFRETTAGELILQLQWTSVSGGEYRTQDVAAVVSDYMLSAHGRVAPLAELPLHLIGHSRGASLVSALSQDLGAAGVLVDQVTYLDPVPVDGKGDAFGINFGDQAMAVYDNTVFADNYWRTDGNANNGDFDGQAVAGTYNGDLNSTVQQNFFVRAHGAVTAYYVGTIDTDTFDGGDHPVLSSWYKGTAAAPDRDETGFFYSRIAGGERAGSGLGAAYGGRAKRVAVDERGSQWANVVQFTSRGSRSVVRGQTLDTRFQYADRDSEVRVEVFADRDTNPYNGVVTGLRVGRLSAADLAAGRIKASTGELSVGTYRIAARVTDGSGHTRWVYSPRSIAVTEPDFASLSGGVLTVSGTDAADTIRVIRDDDFYDVILNGATQRFSVSAVTSVAVQAGNGNDSVDASGLSADLYVNAGAGFDNVVGGAGDDTLSGGAQSDTLNGGVGDDVLNGNGGNNRLLGGGGYDRLYSADGARDTMDGGSNADRFFGGDGDDYMIGGRGNDKMYANAGDDTLIGGQGVDIVNGGAGNDSADDDDTDLRADIEVVLTA